MAYKEQHQEDKTQTQKVKTQSEQSGTPLKKISISSKMIKDRVGEHCTDVMAAEIEKSPNKKKKIVQIKDAINQFTGAVGKRADLAFEALKNPEIGKLFVQNPDWVIKNFSEIVKAGEGLYSDLVFEALKNPEIGKLFAQNPDVFTQIVNENGAQYVLISLFNMRHNIPEVLSPAISEHLHYSFNATFDAMANPEIGKLIIQNPYTFVKIAQATGTSIGRFLNVFSNADIRELFMQNPDAFARIAAMAKESTSGAFKIFENADIRDLFRDNPNAFIEIAAMAQEYTADAFNALEDASIRELFAEKPDEFVKIAYAAGKATGNAFRDLKDANNRELFIQNPSDFIKRWGPVWRGS